MGTRDRFSRGYESLDPPGETGALLAELLVETLERNLRLLAGEEERVRVAPLPCSPLESDRREGGRNPDAAREDGLTVIEYFNAGCFSTAWLLFPPEAEKHFARLFSSFHTEEFEHRAAREMHALECLAANLHALFCADPERGEPAADAAWMLKE